MTARVVCVGTALLDTLVLVDRMPGADERVEVEELVTTGGGNASTSAVAIARLGVDVDFVGAVGDDDAGRRALAGLADEGVGVAGVEVRDADTAQSVVVVARESATRMILTRPADLPARLPSGYEWMHLDKVGHAALVRAGGTAARVSLDDGNPVPDLDLSRIDLYVPTADVLVRRLGGDPLSAGRAALAAGAGAVVATAGSAGSFALAPGVEAFAPGLPVPVRSSLGAGDVFHGALLAAVVLGRSLPEAIRFANVTAALSCRALDGRSGIPDRGEVEAALRELPPSPRDAVAAIAALSAGE